MLRTDLIHTILQESEERGEFIAKSLRGNTLWTLRKDSETYFIVCYQLKSEGRRTNNWYYEKEFEDTPPSTLTCPEKYLTKAAVLCENWRKQVEEYRNKKKSIKFQIRDLYKKKRKDQKVQVKITAKEGYMLRLHAYALKEAVFDVLSIKYGIEGRFDPNGLIYEIPCRLITDVQLLDKKENDD